MEKSFLQHNGKIQAQQDRHRGKFGGGHALLLIVAVQHIFKVLDAIDFMHAFFRGDEEADVVPLSDRLGGIQYFAGLGGSRKFYCTLTWLDYVSCYSEQSQKFSLFLFLYLNRRGILRFAQNDEQGLFSAAAKAGFKLHTSRHGLKPCPTKIRQLLPGL